MITVTIENQKLNDHRKRPTQITMDLQAYKQPWLEWCKEQGVTPSEGFRRIVARLTAKSESNPNIVPARIETDQPERPTIRKEVALTRSEFVRVEALADAEGFSVTKWIIALIRARLTSSAQFGQHELELLGRSNAYLLAIGRNLNQIAKALNSMPYDRNIYPPGLIEELVAEIKTHTKAVSEAMSANVERWRLK